MMAGENEPHIEVVFPGGVEPWVAAQCNGDPFQYTVCDDGRTVLWLLRLLPPPNRVLDVGAGIGRLSVYFKKKMGWQDTDFYLLDGDKGDQQVAGVHDNIHPDHFYNSHEAARKFCIANGIADHHLHVLNVEKDWQGGLDSKFDLAYSFKAIGYHWPVNSYLPILLDLVRPGGVVLFQTRSRNLSPTMRKRLMKLNLTSREKKIAVKVTKINEFLDRVRDVVSRVDDFEVLYCDMESDYGITALRRL